MSNETDNERREVSGMQIWGATDTGLVRTENQDTYLIREEMESGHALGVVCDGMGGPAGGRMASGIAVDIYYKELTRRLRPGMSNRELREASALSVAEANSAIRRAAAVNEEFRHMGTTLVSAVSCEGGAVITNVGDSRAYAIAKDGITRITRDHSLVQDMVDRGEITAEEARRHPQRNVITRALGVDETVQCDVYMWSMEPGSWLLLCSDGLTETVSDQEILFEVLHGGGKEDCLDRLFAIARGRGAPDNVTAVLMRNR